MFTLSAQQQLFAIGTLKVREIVTYQPMTRIPYSHHHVIGTVTIRNLTVPVIDMAAAIGFRPIQPSEYQKCYFDRHRLLTHGCGFHGSHYRENHRV